MRHISKLIKNLALAFKWDQEVLEGESPHQIAKEENISYQYVIRLLNLSFLSPSIVRSILNGTQPADCTLEKLLSIHTSNWQEHEKMLDK